MLEILAVVAIVSLLVAFLIPKIYGFIAQSETIRCLSNLRQIGVAARLFGDEYGGVIVATYYDGSPNNPYYNPANPQAIPDGSWYNQLKPYLINNPELSREQMNQTTPGVLRCPGALRKHPKVPSSGVTYSMNAYIAPHYGAPLPPGGSPTPTSLFRYLEVAQPDQLIFIAHGAFNTVSQAGYFSNMTFGGQHPEALHNDKWAVLFLDGHVANVPPDDYMPGGGNPKFQEHWKILP